MILQDRAHRIGQRNTVRVFRLITYSPVEEKILSRATEKLNMSEIVVEAGKFDKSSVEEDNSQERRKMMEILLTDFDAPTSNNENDSQEDEEANEVDILNEMISNNDAEYDMYCQIDHDRKADAPKLLTDPEDIPDWIKYPKGKKKTSSEKWNEFMTDDQSRKRKRTANNTSSYDDGLTELQFVRMMEKRAEDEELEAKQRKKDRLKDQKKEVELTKDDSSISLVSTVERSESSVDGLDEATFKKLISACKVVIALRESGRKRRLSEIFLEKPCPTTYPDYYQIIKEPVSINDILKKCRSRAYKQLKDFWDDWKLLFNNARQYNEDVSFVHVLVSCIIDETNLESVLCSGIMGCCRCIFTRSRT